MDVEHLFDGPGVPAAVLIGLVGRAAEPTVILTRRQPFLRNHAAEISLPGGRVEDTDDHPATAALRETFEEIGVSPDKVEVLGCLSPVMTVSDFRVYPLVGWIESPVSYNIDEREVAEVFEIPLAFVLDKANHRREVASFESGRHEFDVLEYSGHRVWGATAGILVDLARVLSAGAQDPSE